MRDACAAHSAARPPNDFVGIAIGIGFGSILDLDGEDFFGDEVNLASKLGEDIATGGEVLLTDAAKVGAAELFGGSTTLQVEPREETISAVHLRYWSVSG